MSEMCQGRNQLEDLWRRRTCDALARYQDARTRYREILRERQEGLIPSPDGAYARTQAHHAECSALKEYRRVLSIFTNLVVKGQRPPEE